MTSKVITASVFSLNKVMAKTKSTQHIKRQSGKDMDIFVQVIIDTDEEAEGEKEVREKVVRIKVS